MPRAPFGPNINDPLTRWPELLAYLDATKAKGALPRASVVIGGAPLVRALCEMYPEMVTVARRYGAEDDNRHRVETDGAIWVRAMRDWLGGDRRSYLYWDNEPTYNGLRDADDEYEQLSDDKLLIKRTLEVYKAAHDEGYTVVGPNWSVGWPRDIAQFTEVYAAAVEYGHLIGLHIYGGRNLTDGTAVSWFVSKADEIAGMQPDIRIGLTEFGLDVIGEIPGSGPYKLIGVSGHDYALEHIGIWENDLRYRPYIEWATTFCFGTLNTRWADYDVRGDEGFQNTMLGHQWSDFADVEPIPVPGPEPTPEPEPIPAGPPATMRLARLASTSANGTKVRSGPGTTWAQVGGIPAAGVDGAYDPDYLTADGYQWIEVWTPTVQGWAARSFVDIEGDASDVTELRAQLAAVTAERDALQAWQARVRGIVAGD